MDGLKDEQFKTDSSDDVKPAVCKEGCHSLKHNASLGYQLFFSSVDAPALTIVLAKSLQCSRGTVMWANGKGQMELAKQNEHDFLFHLTATSLVVVVGYEDDNDGKQQTAISVSDAVMWANGQFSQCEISNAIKGHNVIRARGESLVLKKQPDFSLYFVPAPGTVDAQFLKLYHETPDRWKLQLVWVVRWNEQCLQLVPCAVALVTPRARRFSVGEFPLSVEQ